MNTASGLCSETCLRVKLDQEGISAQVMHMNVATMMHKQGEGSTSLPVRCQIVKLGLADIRMFKLPMI